MAGKNKKVDQQNNGRAKLERQRQKRNKVGINKATDQTQKTIKEIIQKK